ncbi:MAG: sulfate transporter CysZ [Pseudomonadales bacterium]|nr:sulfate transporter CysZ [Pseudomonadales bacterium]
MQGNLFRGLGYLYQGAGLLLKPGIWHYVVIPLAINILLFSAIIYYAYHQFNSWVVYLMDWLPGWLSFIDWLLWITFALLITLLVVFSFSLLANFIAAPFNSFLAEAVERRLTGEALEVKPRPLILEILASLARELVKMAYYLPRALALLLLGFIPVVNTVAPVLWFLFGAWMMAIQYLDYPMDNSRISFDRMKMLLKEQRLTPLGYGSAVLLASIVPLVNLIVMPAAVAGATLCWVKEFRREAKPEGF